MTAGTHGSTFGGNPLAMAVANAVLDVVLAPGFLAEVERKGLLLRQLLAEVAASAPGLIEGIRGRGLLTGLKLNIEPPAFVKAALEEKLLVVGAADKTVRVLPPLTVSDAEIAQACQRLKQAAQRLA